jgi:hypothetical protein
MKEPIVDRDPGDECDDGTTYRDAAGLPWERCAVAQACFRHKVSIWLRRRTFGATEPPDLMHSR